jgi:hypothetical protein
MTAAIAGDSEFRALLELSAALGADPRRSQAAGGTQVVKLLCEQPIFAPEFGIYSDRIGAAWLRGGASNTGGA